MRRLFTLAGALVLAAALMPVPASAQVSELIAGSLNNIGDGTNDPFGCSVAEPCNLWQRYWGDLDPREINGPSAPINGYPRYGLKPQRLVGDSQLTSNFPNASLKACEAWYSAWNGMIEPGQGTFVTYYATQSQIVNVSESGQSNLVDCAVAAGQACFGAVDPTFAGPSSPGGPGGLNVGSISGLTPVPAPGLALNAATGNLDVSFPSVAPGNNLNLPSATSVACPPAAPFNDLVVTTAPAATYGIGLFAHLLGEAAPYRSLYDLEGVGAATSPNDLFQPQTGLDGNQVACTGASDCPGIVQISCSEVGGTGCLGALFPPTGATVSLSQAQLGAAGISLGAGDTVVFNTKIFYRGSVPGSQANPANTQVNPANVSLFSANSLKGSFAGLAARVNITRTSLQGNRVTLEFEATGDNFVSFTIQRADDGITFADLGTVDGVGAGSYSFVDTLRGRRPAATTYRILAEDIDGNVSQVFETVDLRGADARSPRR